MSPNQDATTGETSPGEGKTSPAVGKTKTKSKGGRSVAQKPNPAAALLMANERKRADDKRDALEKLNEDNLFFMRCLNNAKHHALYMTEYPSSGMLHPGMWFTIEHRPGERWVDEQIRCQECLVDGDKAVWLPLRPARMPDGQVSFTVVLPPGVPLDMPAPGKGGTGMVGRISREDLEARLGDGQTLESIFSAEAAAEGGA